MPYFGLLTYLFITKIILIKNWKNQLKSFKKVKNKDNLNRFIVENSCIYTF